MQRGHWKLGASVGPGPACGLETLSGVEESLKDSDRGLESESLGRAGKLGLAFGAGEAGGRLVVLAMAAFKTWGKDGLIPQARHGGRGVCAFAAAGSKFEGTGFEKLQIVQTHVAEEAGLGSGGFLGELSWRGELVNAVRDAAAAELAGLRRDARFEGFGTMVILGDDFQNPA